MQYREIKQHHIPAIISVFALFAVDILSFFLAYIIAVNGVEYPAGFKYPLRVLILIVGLIYIFKRYNPSPTLSRGYESKILIQLYYLVGIAYMVYRILSGTIRIDQAQFELIFIHVFIFLDILLRIGIRSIQRYFLSKGIGGRRTIIIGKGEDAYHIANEINQNHSLGFTLKGYFDDSSSSNMDRYCTYLGKPEKIESYIKQHNIHEMIVALEEHEHEKLLHIIGQYNLYDICIKIIPDMYEAISGQVRIDTIRGLPLLNINPDIKTEFQGVLKRMGDVFLSLFGLILLLPIIMLIAVLVRISSKGNIFYRQIRVGLNGVHFTLLKFRTMYVGSEDNTGPIWSIKEDPRTTHVGKVLRKYHLDEIPQMLNVFYGHMSIIGPRPERPEIIENLIKEVPYYAHRLKVKPGLTGWAQVMGIYDSSIADVKSKLKLDFYYIENMSLLLDLKIIIITLIIILKGRGR